MCLKQQLENKLKITFASPSENSEEKNKEKKIVAKLFPLHANEKNFEKIKNKQIANRHGLMDNISYYTLFRNYE